MQTGGTLRDFVIRDSHFAKLRELSLSYDAPERFAGKVGAKGLSLSVSGRNLHTWTPYSGLDPENQFITGNFGVDQAEYPQLTSFVFTVHLNY
jgi:hypothetical protein